MPQVEYDESADLGTIYYTGTSADSAGAQSEQATIQFQHGPVLENGVNGVQNEQVLELLAMRLRALNARFPCRENSLAITKIEEARLWLEERTRVRVDQGVEGKNEAHVS